MLHDEYTTFILHPENGNNAVLYTSQCYNFSVVRRGMLADSIKTAVMTISVLCGMTECIPLYILQNFLRKWFLHLPS
jgi:hypothetical protein